MRRSVKRGFTLVEIIVVLVIVAILAAAIIPTMYGAVAEAKKSEAVSECRQAVISAAAESVKLYGQGKLISEKTLEAGVYIDEIIYNSGVFGTITSITCDVNTAKIKKLNYIASNGYSVTYDPDADEVYKVGDLFNDSAPGYTSDANGLMASLDILNTVSGRNYQTQKLQDAFYEQNGGKYPKFSSSEKEMMESLGYNNPEALNWRPIISAEGEVILVGATSSDSVRAPLASVIYYKGDYYYWYHSNQVKTVWVSDQNFSLSSLDNTKTELDPDGNASWLVYKP